MKLATDLRAGLVALSVIAGSMFVAMFATNDLVVIGWGFLVGLTSYPLHRWVGKGDNTP